MPFENIGYKERHSGAGQQGPRGPTRIRLFSASTNEQQWTGGSDQWRQHLASNDLADVLTNGAGSRIQQRAVTGIVNLEVKSGINTARQT